MKQNNFTSLLFAVVLLASITPFKTGKDVPGKRMSEKIQVTSVESVEVPSVSVARQFSVSNQTFLNSEPATVSIKRISGILDPIVGARSVIVSDLDSGEIFFEKNGSRNYSLASLTKLMAAVVATEIVGTEKLVPLKGGGMYSSGDLIRAMLIASDNEAAAALAEFYGLERFIALMNDKAASLGMNQTRFFDASGLHPQNQSSVRDLSKLAFYISKEHQNLFEISRQGAAAIMNLDDGSIRPILTTIRFVDRPDFLGGKTGFINSGVANLLSIFYYNNHRILIVVLGAADQESRFVETEDLLNWLKRSYAF
ncbi:hypothetical protein A3A20_00690 [Candidatus Wolfebacteria bacterium RIFCSPLOWO2_01_FULL_45_19]|uniref:Peptidase S11 D-alanyl-D-alanine carboxypeptidase A N-terminal domain-containing protein n=1 Tax=Candidatus Wolfebacteria bacterium RIFCSPLOWO2_01_FULL_45_19 TaxID=1802557 RepID=A0A1F8DPS2_9BACT|nr:MAG: Peptidase S11 D-alanyl-D-alanine carboxypeptidase 1 [Parcubacteria group bacterium GW2011_GWB1_45_9]OGM90621.1 MAG: hypothetical protein A3A20_00690 [Candidatus Wolfebacteria bacterium RIFCSPLOWO2_01_FULL_45_19]